MAQCWSKKKKNVNQVEKDQQQKQHDHQQEADPEFNDEVYSVVQSQH
jgi:hypothetical protein